MIIDHTNEKYILRRMACGDNAYNGAYYYSKEIVENIIPRVQTDRNWVTINTGECADHSILFVHSNIYFEQAYEYARRYDDVLYVVSLPDMIDRVKKFGQVIYLPMSVDVKYIKTFRRKKDREIAFCGRDEWAQDASLAGAERVGMLPRTEFLRQMARYENVYAVCRVAIEAKILGCNVLPFHPRFQDPGFFQVLDNREAAQILQMELDKIDGGKNDY